jgi:hypothetical protein
MAVEPLNLDEEDVKFEIINIFRAVYGLLQYFKIEFEDSECRKVHTAIIFPEELNDKNQLRKKFLEVWWDYKRKELKIPQPVTETSKVGDII